MIKKEDGRARFDHVWKPLIGFGVLLGFGLQSVLPYVSPALPLIGVILVGTFYHMSYTNHINDPTDSKMIEWAGVIIGLAFLMVGLLTIAQAIGTLIELAEPCSKMRESLKAKPSSELSDTYTALHCPVFLPRWHWF